MIFNFALILASPNFNTFQGGVKYIQDGVQVDVPQGTNISAYINGVYSSSDSVGSGSSYILVVSGDSADLGKTITFKVGGTFTDQNYSYSAQGIYALNLTVDKTAPTITIGSYNHNPTNQSITVTATTNEGTLNTVSHTFTANGDFTFTATDAAGNSNSTTVTITNIDKTTPSFTKANNLTAYNNQSLSSDLIDVSESVTLSINVNPNFSITSQGVITNATSLALGSSALTIVATDAAGNSQTVNIFLTIIESDQQYAEEENVTVGANTSDIIFNSGSSAVEKIIIPSTIASDKEINLDMSALLSSSNNVSVGGDIILERQTTSINYTATIFSGTVISGNSTWDGVLELPQVSTLTSDLGTVNTVIQIGASQRLNFSDAVKVVLGGMTGKKALWSDSTGTYSIGLCSDANATSPGSLTSGECYLDDGTDLIVWTYHFTKFGAYTPTSSGGGSSGGSSGGGGGSSCYTNWTCTSWSSCLNNVQTRTCIKEKLSCNTKEVKPLESQACDILGGNNLEGEGNEIPSKENSEANTGGITGFSVIGEAVASPVGIVILVLIGLIILVWIIVKISKKKRN